MCARLSVWVCSVCGRQHVCVRVCVYACLITQVEVVYKFSDIKHTFGYLQIISITWCIYVSTVLFTEQDLAIQRTCKFH